MLARYTERCIEVHPYSSTNRNWSMAQLSKSALAPPLGELSPQVTKRAFCLQIPSPPQFANWGTSPTGRGKGVLQPLIKFKLV